MSTITLLEHVATRGRVDREAGIIYGAKILGRNSANRRQYSDDALNDATRLYEGRKVCLNHDRSDPKRERGILEEVAVIRNARRKGDGVYGDLHMFQSHKATPLILERADKFPDTFGLSHNAEGKQSRDGRIIESLSMVRSVDIVGDPATNAGLFESRGYGAGSSIPSDAAGFAALARAGVGVVLESASPAASYSADDLPSDSFHDTKQRIQARCTSTIGDVVRSDQSIDAKLKSIREVLEAMQSALDELDTAGAAIDSAADDATKMDDDPAMESFAESRTEQVTKRFMDSVRYS
jgi:hypothetical protein